jgi:hypothetical protein
MQTIATFLLFGLATPALAAGGLPPTPGCVVFDQGFSDTAIGLQNGTALAWLQRQGAPGLLTSVSAIHVVYGSPFALAAPPRGTPSTIAVWDDPNDDGNPDDLVLLRTVDSWVVNGNTDVFDTVILVPPVAVSGSYFIGVAMAHIPGTFPASIDENPGLSNGRSWFAASVGGPLDLANLPAAALPPTDIGEFNILGVWMLRATCSPAMGAGYCQGTVGTCPCSNAGDLGRGCENSEGAGGGQLTATGNASIAADTLRLVADGLPSTSTCLFAQSTSTGGGGFGDGRQCLGAGAVRLRIRTAVSGVASLGAGNPGDPSISTAGGVTPGTFHYQGFYRDAPAFCTSATFNATNGFTIVWN